MRDSEGWTRRWRPARCREARTDDEAQGEARGARVLGRPRHQHHRAVVEGALRLRGGVLLQRRGPGRRGVVRARGESAQDRRRRRDRGRPARAVRARLLFSRPAGGRRLRRPLPVGHGARPAADRVAPGVGGTAHALRRAGARLHGQGQRPGPLRAGVHGARAGTSRPRAVARVDDRLARGSAGVRAGPRRAGVAEAGRPLLARRQPLASFTRGRPARRSGRATGGTDVQAHVVARSVASAAGEGGRGLRGRPAHERQRQGARARGAARAAEPDRRPPRRRPRRRGREPVGGHEVARRVRDAGRQRCTPRAPRSSR